MRSVIAPKPFAEFGEDEFHAYVSSTYSLPAKRAAARGSKPQSPVDGITVTQTKSGGLGVRRTQAKRAFAYVTWSEIGTLSKAYGAAQSDLWNLFKRKKFIVAKDRLDAESQYAATKGSK